MIRNALLASAIVLGAIGNAQAQDGGPRLIGGGNDSSVEYAAPSQNLVGGGVASITGGGENQSLAYGGTTPQAPSGLVAEVIGGGENRQLVYHALPAPGRVLASQGAPRQGG